MKKSLFLGIALLLLFAVVLAIAPRNANAELLYAEDFEDGASGLYGWWGGWSIANEGDNDFYRSVSDSGNYVLMTSQAFPNGVSIKFKSRNTSLENGVLVYGNGWQYNWWTTGTSYGLTGHYPGKNYAIDGILGTLTLQDEWYDVETTLIGGIGRFYIDGVLISEYNIGASMPIPLENFQIGWCTVGQRDLDNIQVNAVPEPATMLLLASGLAGLAGFRRKFRKR